MPTQMCQALGWGPETINNYEVAIVSTLLGLSDLEARKMLNSLLNNNCIKCSKQTNDVNGQECQV